MANIIVGLAKYMMIILIAIYTYQCFAVFGYEEENAKKRVFRNQISVIFMIHFMAFAGMYFKTSENKIMIFYLVQAMMLAAIIWLYKKIYPKSSRLIINNMCMLMTIGFIMITRLSYMKAVKQCIIVAGAIVASLFVPVLIRRMRKLHEMRIL